MSDIDIKQEIDIMMGSLQRIISYVRDKASVEGSDSAATGLLAGLDFFEQSADAIRNAVLYGKWDDEMMLKDPRLLANLSNYYALVSLDASSKLDK